MEPKIIDMDHLNNAINETIRAIDSLTLRDYHDNLDEINNVIAQWRLVAPAIADLLDCKLYHSPIFE